MGHLETMGHRRLQSNRACSLSPDYKLIPSSFYNVVIFHIYGDSYLPIWILLAAGRDWKGKVFFLNLLGFHCFQFKIICMTSGTFLGSLSLASSSFSISMTTKLLFCFLFSPHRAKLHDYLLLLNWFGECIFHCSFRQQN